jgi:hypothetical protein
MPLGSDALGEFHALREAQVARRSLLHPRGVIWRSHPLHWRHRPSKCPAPGPWLPFAATALLAGAKRTGARLFGIRMAGMRLAGMRRAEVKLAVTLC